VSEENPLKGKTGLKRLWNALHYSFAGLSAALACEAAFRQEMLLAAILIPLSFFLPVTWTGRALMITSVLLVLIVELVNSAIEAIVDRVSLDRHPLSKRAKDVGSAAVLLALLDVVVVWGGVLLDAW
jgi:diacylglycerol kinase (ATP)